MSWTLLPLDLQSVVVSTFVRLHEGEPDAEKLRRVMLLRLLCKGYAVSFKGVACEAAYSMLITKRKMDRDAVPPPPVPAGLLAIMPHSVADSLMDHQDALLLLQYNLMAKNNPDAAFAGLKMLVNVQRLMNAPNDP
jgi:hypothetical protein